MPLPSFIHVFPDAAAASRGAAEAIAEILAQSVKERGMARFAISGGSSPKLMFAELAKTKIDWTNIFIYWVDERVVPPDHADSNFKMAMEHLIQPAGIDVKNLNRIAGERYPEEAAAHYASELAVDFKLGEGEVPVFDVIHRGMGPDSHTASLFPGDPLVEDDYDVVGNTYVEKFNSHRVTLLPAVLKAARHTVILSPGADKAEALKAVLDGPIDLLEHPCQIAATPPYPTEWYIDEPAARLLKK
jgi:6-phosphogluconolactonase